MKNWNKRPIIDGKRECCKCGLVLELETNFYGKYRKGKRIYEYVCKKCRPYSAERMRDVNLRSNYDGFTSAQYDEMLEQQSGVCASCGHTEIVFNHGRLMPLSVDHCHTTGAIRGLLCKSCNQALGLLFEDPERIEALLKYVHERVLY